MTQAEAYATEEGRYIAEGTWQDEGGVGDVGRYGGWGWAEDDSR